MGYTPNFINIWLKLLEENDDTRRVVYITAMKDIFKQIPLTLIKALNPKQKFQKIMTDIGGGWYTEKIAKGIPQLKRSKLSKKSQYKEDEIIKKQYKAWK